MSDAEMEAAIRLLLEHTRNLAEHAGAAALAAAFGNPELVEGSCVVLVLLGGNLAWPEQRRVVAG